MSFWKKGITLIIYVVFMVMFLKVCRIITKELGIFYLNVDIYVTVLLGIFIICFYRESFKIALFSYLLMLIIFMTFREKVDISYNFDWYLWKWLKVIDKNKTVLINVFGNIILFFPVIVAILSIKENYFISFLVTTIIIILLELVQLISRRGVFDLVDIVLNVFGIIIGMIIYRVISYVSQTGKKEKNGTFI